MATPPLPLPLANWHVDIKTHIRIFLRHSWLHFHHDVATSEDCFKICTVQKNSPTDSDKRGHWQDELYTWKTCFVCLHSGWVSYGHFHIWIVFRKFLNMECHSCDISKCKNKIRHVFVFSVVSSMPNVQSILKTNEPSFVWFWADFSCHKKCLLRARLIPSFPIFVVTCR